MNDGTIQLFIWRWAPNVPAPNEVLIYQTEDIIIEIICLQQWLWIDPDDRMWVSENFECLSLVTIRMKSKFHGGVFLLAHVFKGSGSNLLCLHEAQHVYRIYSTAPHTLTLAEFWISME